MFNHDTAFFSVVTTSKGQATGTSTKALKAAKLPIIRGTAHRNVAPTGKPGLAYGVRYNTRDRDNRWVTAAADSDFKLSEAACPWPWHKSLARRAGGPLNKLMGHWHAHHDRQPEQHAHTQMARRRSHARARVIGHPATTCARTSGHSSEVNAPCSGPEISV